jgi:hypothetical protein
MRNLPPAIYEHYFDDLDKPQHQIEAIFTPVINDLIDYLNQLPCLSGLQSTRLRQERISRASGWGKAFRSVNHLHTGHWYIFNWGGRNEMQFNIGMYSSKTKEVLSSAPYVRIGVGFNFQRNKWGDPDKVQLGLKSFYSKVERNPSLFRDLVKHNRFDVESPPSVNVNNIVTWLETESQKRPDAHAGDWIFIGRRLQRGIDTNVLESPALLDQVIVSIYSSLISYY